MQSLLRQTVWLLPLACAALPGAATAANEGAPVVEPASEQVLKRLDRIERKLENQSLLDLYNQVQTLQSQVKDLRGQLETQQHELEQMIQRQKELYADLDSRLQELKSDGAGDDTGTGNTVAPDTGSSDTGTAGNTAADSGSSATAGGGDTSDARQAYDKAFDMLKNGQYEESIAAFKQYLQQYPDSDYADNASYWLGEAYYVTGDFSQAIDAYQQLLNDFPDSQKAPHAQLKIGYSQQELGNKDAARQTLQDLRGRYPDSTAASLAQERLQQL